MLSTVDILEILKNTPGGYKPPDDELFVENNKLLLTQYKKLGVISNKDDEDDDEDKNNIGSVKGSSTQFNKVNKEIFCNIPGCAAIFNGVAAFQTHFNAVHRYFCAECRRSLPNSHLLDLHICEHHDSYFIASAERGKAMYRCFLEECKESFLTPKERKDHCVRLHNFPATFRFDQWGGEKSKTKKTATGKHQKNTQKTEEMMLTDQEQNEIQDAVRNLDASVRQIKAFSFGHHVEKTFQQKSVDKQKKKKQETLENLSEMASALDDVME